MLPTAGLQGLAEVPSSPAPTAVARLQTLLVWISSVLLCCACRAINIENNKPNAVVNLLTGEEGAVPATARGAQGGQGVGLQNPD